MFEAKTYEELMDDAIFAVLGTSGQLSDFSEGSDLYALVRGFMTVLAKGYSNLQDAVDDSVLSTASGTQLDAHTGSFGVYRLQGSLSVGSLLAVPQGGAASVMVLANTRRFVYNGRLYTNTTDVLLQAPYTVIPVSATQVGAAYDLAPGNVMLDVAADLNPYWTFTTGSGYTGVGQPTGFIRGGSDRESNEALRARFSDFISSLSKGTYKSVRTAILGVPDVESVVLKQYSPAVGWFTAYIDDGTDAPSQELLAQVEQALDTNKALGIGYRVLPMAKTFVPITIVVKVDPLYVTSGTAIADMCSENIQTLLKTYTFGESLYLSKLMEACHAVPGVLRASVYLPSTDVLVSPEEAIRAGAVTVTAVI